MTGTDEHGERVTLSLRTHNRQVAQNLIREVEARGHVYENFSPEALPITNNEAFEKYLADAVSRGLREATLYKFRLLFGRLQSFAQERGLRFPKDFTVDQLRQFRAAWPHRGSSANKRLEELRAFFDSATTPAGPLKMQPGS